MYTIIISQHNINLQNWILNKTDDQKRIYDIQFLLIHILSIVSLVFILLKLVKVPVYIVGQKVQN